MVTTAAPDLTLRLRFSPRGIGKDGGAPCFVCGDESCRRLADNIAAFVGSKEDGERVAALFVACGSHGWLDYRDYEPNWVQYKLMACPAHLPNLERLYALTAEDRVITLARLLEAMHA